MRQATAYVDVDKSPSSYDVFYDQEYEVFTDEKKVGLFNTAHFTVTRESRDVDVLITRDINITDHA